MPGRRIIRGLGTFLAALSSIAWLAAAFGWFRGVRRIPILREVAKKSGPIDQYPSVSVVVPARDEEAKVGETLRSILDQDYPGRLEVVAVDDRSADRTGKIIAGLAAQRPEKLKALRVDSLTDGWLGKNYALYRGAEEASGEWLLFTDADVRIAPGCIGDAIHYALKENLDHLTLSPELVSRGVALKSFVAAFVLVFGMTQRP
jgi:cellulose synthase/poly-beta-1,6-N-acetylglucosamine synthase-like glycosyltransferase